jgi:hypothetical protein
MRFPGTNCRRVREGAIVLRVLLVADTPARAVVVGDALRAGVYVFVVDGWSETRLRGVLTSRSRTGSCISASNWLEMRGS